MANEITVTARLAANNTLSSVSNATQAFSHTMVGTPMAQVNPTITTTAALVSVAPVSTGTRYHLFLRNTNGTNEVRVSFDGGTRWPIVILPLKSMGPIVVESTATEATMAFWLDAQVASCVVEIIAVQI